MYPCSLILSLLYSVEYLTPSIKVYLLALRIFRDNLILHLVTSRIALMVWLLSWTLKKNQLLVKLLLELYKYKGFFVDQQADD